jgi:hypothetical protein
MNEPSTSYAISSIHHDVLRKTHVFVHLVVLWCGGLDGVDVEGGLALALLRRPAAAAPAHTHTAKKNTKHDQIAYSIQEIKDVAVPTTQIFCCFEWIEWWASYLAAPAAGMGGKPCRTAAAPKKLLHRTTHFEIVKKSADCPYKSTEIDEMI